MKTRCFFLLSVLVLLAACTSTKNTSGTRWYHSFNTRYNIYFNGNEAYKQAFKALGEGNTENYSEIISMYPISSIANNDNSAFTGSATGNSPGTNTRNSSTSSATRNSPPVSNISRNSFGSSSGNSYGSTAGSSYSSMGSSVSGSFDVSLEKAVKAIKLHSIQTKPERKQSRDPKYREFVNRKEFNPFLHNAWMLMARSQFYKGNFLEAASSFSYISRLYESQPEITNTAKIWKARCYSELGWYYDADNILSKMNVNQLTNPQKDLFTSVYADYFVKQKKYIEAIPYLKNSIAVERNRGQQAREKYLLGQLYAATDQKELAYKTFGTISSSSAPYVLELSAKIRQTEVYPGGDINKINKQLIQMTKKTRNTDYLDQIYYALGNIYMTVPDTVKAVQSYESGVEKSTRNGIDKTLNQIKLGDIYFNQRQFLKAQPNYADALKQLKKSDEAYPRVAKRSEALDALVIHYEAVELQDSLQRLSRMTEEERLAVVNKIIADLIKKEKEEQKKATQEENRANQEALQGQQQANRPNMPAVVNPAAAAGGTGGFYFYNPQAVAVGKNMFQQKWGRRNLEDNWQRRNKSNPLSFDSQEDLAATDTATTVTGTNDTIQNGNDKSTAAANQSNATATSNDPKDPQFYLQQIPITADELAASDLIISNGLFNMGVIYKDLLEDNLLALETFEKLNSRFPDNDNREMAYYYMYLIYWQEGNMEMANLYKTKIREGFPDSDLAIAMADPDYEYNQMTMDSVQETLYQQTYADYLSGNNVEIRKIYELISTKYSQAKLMPKFMFLNALSFASTNEVDSFKVLLKNLITKYPKEDVSVLASEMMKGFQRGLLLSASGDNMLSRGSVFNMRFGSDSTGVAPDSTLLFSTETKTPHELLLIYPKGSIDDNVLYFTVAKFNFGNFMVSDFDLERTTIRELSLLQIKGFNSQGEVIQYLQKIHQPDGYAKEWGQVVTMIPISEENYATLMKGKNLDEYMAFFEKNFSAGNESLIAEWRVKQAEELKVLPDNKEKNPVDEENAKDRKIEENQSSKTVSPTDTIHPVVPPITGDSIQPASPDSTSTKVDAASDKIDESIDKAYNEASNKLDDLSNKYNNFASDPVRGILNLFKRDKKNNAIEEFAKQQEKEDKERQMQLKKEQDEKDKAAKAEALQKEKEQNELIKKKAEEAKAAEKAKQQQQIDLAKAKKQKDAERKQLAKDKKDAQAKALKQKEADRKAKEKVRQEEMKRKAKEREELRKQKEQERKARIKK